MLITKTLDAANRRKWRAWLQKNYDKEPEIWLVYYRTNSHKARIPYNDAVEEALCFGWIDGQVKNIDKDSYAQRFSPRRPGSKVSEMNKERIRRLMKKGKMTDAGLDKVRSRLEDKFRIPQFILRALKLNENAWKNFQSFPESYKRIRIGWIANTRLSDRQRRLKYFVKMTAKNKRYGMVQ